MADHFSPEAPRPVLVKRSRSSIFDLFSRPNVERARGAREAPLPADLPRQRPATLRKSSASTTQESISPLDKQDPQYSRSTKGLKSSRRQSELPPRLEAPPFENPPLFQAYPQSVRHVILESPDSSHGASDSSDRSTLERRDDPASTPKSTPAHRVFDMFKTRRKQTSPPLAPVERPASVLAQFQQKVYVLVTSGYLLQYSGDGKYDRSPEAVLKLGAESAAFVCDELQGKHFVLKVVHDKSGFGNALFQKPLASKMGFQTTVRQDTMLLIFTAAEDMDQWMLVLRKEIAALGGQTEILDKPIENVSKNHRYSTIVRIPSARSTHSETRPLVNSVATSPTLVDSRRTSFATLVGSSDWSSSRSSRQPGPLVPVQEAYGTDDMGEEGYGLVAPSSPGLFEREASPAPSEARSSPLDRSPTAGSRLPTVPSIPPEYAHLRAPESPKRMSLQSHSSKGSMVGDLETGQQATQKMTLKHANISVPDQPIPLRTYQLHPSTTPPRLGSFQAGTVPTAATTPSTALQPQRLQLRQRSESMERLSKMPPLNTNPPSTRSIGLFPLTSSTLSQAAYTRRSSLATPGEGFASHYPSGRSVKSKSVFSRPIPVSVSATPRPSPPGSNRISLQPSPRPSPNSSNRVSMQPPQSPSSEYSDHGVSSKRSSPRMSTISTSTRSSTSIEMLLPPAAPRPISLHLLESLTPYTRTSSRGPSPDLTNPRTSTQCSPAVVTAAQNPAHYATNYATSTAAPANGITFATSDSTSSAAPDRTTAVTTDRTTTVTTDRTTSAPTDRTSSATAAAAAGDITPTSAEGIASTAAHGTTSVTSDDTTSITTNDTTSVAADDASSSATDGTAFFTADGTAFFTADGTASSAADGTACSAADGTTCSAADRTSSATTDRVNSSTSNRS